MGQFKKMQESVERFGDACSQFGVGATATESASAKVGEKMRKLYEEQYGLPATPVVIEQQVKWIQGSMPVPVQFHGVIVGAPSWGKFKHRVIRIAFWLLEKCGCEVY